MIHIGRPLQGEIRKCIKCHTQIRVAPSAIKRGKGKFCSQECASADKSVTKHCQECKKEFTVLKVKLESGRGKFCSRDCYIQDWSRRIPGWNKGQTATWSLGNEYRKGIPNLKPNRMFGTTNPKWKGDKVGYSALHDWVQSHLGTPNTCEHCFKTGLSGHKIHWANKSRNYLRKKDDWLRLCVQCHKNYDKK